MRGASVKYQILAKENVHFLCCQNFVLLLLLLFKLMQGYCLLLISSVQQLSLVQLFVTPWTAASQATLSITISQGLLKLMSIESVCHPTISSFVIPFSSCLLSFPASGSFSMSQFFASGGQNIGTSALASVLPMSIQERFPLGLTGWTCSQSKELSRVFSNTTVQKHQLFGTQPSFWSNSYIHTQLMEKKKKTDTFDQTDLYQQSNVSAF